MLKAFNLTAALKVFNFHVLKEMNHLGTPTSRNHEKLKRRVSKEIEHGMGSFRKAFESDNDVGGLFVKSEVGGESNREVVSFRSCVRTRGLVA